MIDRRALVRGFFALLLLAAACAGAYALLSDTEGTSGNFPEDGESVRYGAVYEQPDASRSLLDVDPWIRDLEVSGGTYASKLPAQVRISFDGSGPIPSRDVTLQSRPAVELFAGTRRVRAEGVLRGTQRLLEDRDGLIRGMALTDSRGGAQAAAMANIVRLHVADGVTDPRHRRELEGIVREVSSDLADHALAWYDFRFQDIVFGPEISSGLMRWIRTPGRTTPEENLHTAYVLRHELEHAVTPPTRYDDHQLEWLEEGSVDVLARWPGVAAGTARELGMTYPGRFERLPFEPRSAGYPEWAATMRVLLAAAGIDTSDPAEFDAASELLQRKEVSQSPARIAAAIAKANRLGPAGRRRIERAIAGLDGDTDAARRLVGSLRA